MPEVISGDPPSLEQIWQALAAHSASHDVDWRATIRLHEGRNVEIVASRDALVRFALEFIALAHNGVDGSHLQFDQASWLDEGSQDLTVELVEDA